MTHCTLDYCSQEIGRWQTTKVALIEAKGSVAHGSVGEEDAVWVHVQHFAGRIVGRHHRQPAAERRQPPQNVVLDAKVIRHNLQSSIAL